ncbi:hypothetical protein FRB99_007026 [Tulasnella sp. 403]|nr:hypothetical protein FRB99_007026 [Tulasnella sp. 403]
MSATRRGAEKSTSRRVNRQQNASPYGKRRVPQSSATTPQVEAREIKSSSSFSTLWNFLNPFKRRHDTPKPLPQSQQEDYQDYGVEEHDLESVPRDRPPEEDVGDESQFVDDALMLQSSASSLRIYGGSQAPLPLVSPQKFNTAPSTTTNDTRQHQRLFRPALNDIQFQSPPLTASQLGPGPSHVTPPSASALKPLQDFLGERARTGTGLSSQEVQQLSGMLHAQVPLPDESNLPSAAFLGSELIPSPSTSFLAPKKQAMAPSQSAPVFMFTAGNKSSSPKPMAFASQSQHTRRRPEYVGPGQGSNVRPIRSTMLIKSLSANSNLSQKASSTNIISRSSTMKNLSNHKRAGEEPESTNEGKRRRVDGNPYPSGGLSNPETEEVVDTPTTPIQPEAIASDLAANGMIHSVAQVTKTSPLKSSAPPIRPSVNTTTTSKPLRPSQSGHLRAPPNPTSPAVPSPLRNMTTATDSPSPPRRSRTSTTMMDIIRDANREINASGSSISRLEIEQAVTNPFEKPGPRAPIPLPKKKPIASKKALQPPKKTDPPKTTLPSSAQAIVASLPPTKKSLPKSGTQDAQASNDGVPQAPPAAPNSKPQLRPTASPFLPPVKAKVPIKANGSMAGSLNIDDVDAEDEIVEIQENPTKSGGSSANGVPPRRHSPPPIVIKELNDEDATAGASSDKSIKASVVMEPGESRRIGRSPSVGPHSSLYSPTIPSPLRLVSMPPAEDGVEEKPLITIAATTKHAAVTSIPVSRVKEPSSLSKPEDVPVTELPAFRFEFKAAASVRWADLQSVAGQEAIKIPITSLPTYDFTSAMSSVLSRPPTSIPPTLPIFPQTLPKPAFNWSDAGFKPKVPDLGSWTCPQCMLSNPATASDKCTVCGADSPTPSKSHTQTPVPTTSAPVPTQFDWNAAGLAPKSVTTGSWVCSLCSCTNPHTATEKCTVCGEVAPGAKKDSIAPPVAEAPANPPPVAFNWAAAGLQPKTADAGSWTCSTCGLSNDGSLKEKCGICGAAR